MNEKTSFSSKISSKAEKARNLLREINRLNKKKNASDSKKEKERVSYRLNSTKKELEKINSKISNIFDDFYGNKKDKKQNNARENLKNEITDLEKITLNRILKKRSSESKKKKKEKQDKNKRNYSKTASKMFSKTSKRLINKGLFQNLENNLTKANLGYIARGYLSVIFLNTLISFFIALFFVFLFSFFSISLTPPFFNGLSDSFFSKFIGFVWVLFVFPIITFLFSYFYPMLEKRSVERKIDSELPFATINMAAISGSMIDPSQIFKIIISTGEYPELKKEFTKLINQINIYGYDFVSALRSSSQSTPSEKLSELYSGLANTISSGGDLSAFFDKKSESFLFEHKTERKKSTKTAETFMDIYISVVIAAPMILMLILVMMKISGLGFNISTKMITIIMVLGVSVINVGFLVFLHLKQK